MPNDICVEILNDKALINAAHKFNALSFAVHFSERVIGYCQNYNIKKETVLKMQFSKQSLNITQIVGSGNNRQQLCYIFTIPSPGFVAPGLD